MKKIVIYVVVGSDAGELAPGGIKVVRVQAESTRKSARQNVNNKPLVAMQRESLCSHWHSGSRKLLLAVGRDAGDR